MKKVLFYGGLLVIAALAYFIFKMPKKEQENLDSKKVQITDIEGRVKTGFKVELAETSEQRETGLMFREQLDEGSGMLFVFEDEKIRKFWMKDTYIPLDMIFINSNGEIVGIVENAEPKTLTPRFVNTPNMYVLEINSGLVKKYGINEKDIVINLPNNHD